MEDMLIKKVGRIIVSIWWRGTDDGYLGMWRYSITDDMHDIQSLTTQAERILSQFDNVQLGVMTWATALFEGVSQ